MVSFPPQLPVENEEKLPESRRVLKKAEEVVKSTAIYTALAAVITGIASAALLIYDNVRIQKEGERLANVYLILEVTLIVAVVAFVAIKMFSKAF